MVTPEKTKDFVMSMLAGTNKIIKKRFPNLTVMESLDISQEVVDLSFNLMLITHSDEKQKTDDDIPF